MAFVGDCGNRCVDGNRPKTMAISMIIAFVGDDGIRPEIHNITI